MGTHTHDDYDWVSKIAYMRRGAAIHTAWQRDIADRLVGMLRPGATVIDVGSGAGGMAAQFALALGAQSGGHVVLVDAVPELLTAAGELVRATSDGKINVTTVLADAAGTTLAELVPAADLVWASFVVHHLRDQQEGITNLTRVVAPGGWLALTEGGLGTQCVPWDLGVGAPGLIDRIQAARKQWFAQMRADIPGSTRLTVGWTKALSNAGLSDITSFTSVVDYPPPVTDDVRAAIVDWFTHITSVAMDHLATDDQQAVNRLLDPADTAYIGSRDDVFYLAADTVNLGRRP
ncbi:class I SAM-dependent methyltransferase [Actinocrispum wychmicini]|uniref:UbiE/COQ5 methyltransferase-like protein n=1 Tax=Actinocrispum wychmicini TaxID=1213861 RepID=A0A4R2JZW2_9PSEU|nr:class I SAM-dependent methyltransferase [Actinocrispum wychmicini]TCO62988.1 ubiE/COQ5 methyltransferase-like protein [Actinocrispum wychmicini]